MAGMGKMERRQDLAIQALLMQPTVQEAAKAARVGERSLWRWLQLPDFQERYRAARRASVSQAVSRLQQASGGAVQCLVDVMEDTNAPATARVAAARTCLEMAIRGIELEDLASRVEALEQVAAEGSGKRWN